MKTSASNSTEKALYFISSQLRGKGTYMTVLLFQILLSILSVGLCRSFAAPRIRGRGGTPRYLQVTTLSSTE